MVYMVWGSVRSCNTTRAALGELRLGLRDADLVQLKPGEQLLQQSSWVLLKGTLKTKGLAAKVPAGMPGVHLLQPRRLVKDAVTQTMCRTPTCSAWKGSHISRALCCKSL